MITNHKPLFDMRRIRAYGKIRCSCGWSHEMKSLVAGVEADHHYRTHLNKEITYGNLW